MPETVLELKPQVNISRSTATRMWLVFCCAFIAVIQSSVSDSGASFFIALTAVFAALITELLITYPAHGFSKIGDGSAAASALVLALLLPNQINPVYAAFGAVFAIAVIKHSFGGLGANWLNPALGGWIFIHFSWPLTFNRALETASSEVPESATSVSYAISGFLNKVVFSVFHAELPSAYIDLFSLQTPGIIADRAVLALVVVTSLVAAFQISHSWMSIVYLAVYGFLIRLAGCMQTEGLWWSGDILFGFLSGGTLVAAFILIADPSSGARSAAGNAIVAVSAAIFSFAFRFPGGCFYGCFFAVAVVNALTPILCQFERRSFYKRLAFHKNGAKGGGS